MASADGGFGTVVVPLDGSPFGERALPYAAQVARSLGVPLLLVSAAHLDALTTTDGAGMGTAMSGEMLTTLIDQELAGVRSYLDTVRGRLQAAGVTVESHAEYGYPATMIRETITSRPGALVVMSTHGRGGVARVALGSVADQIVRDGGRPAIVVRPTAHEEVDDPIRHVLVALDGSPLSEQSLPPALAIARATNAKVTLLRVAESEAEAAGARAYLEHLATSVGGNPGIHVWSGRPAESILQAAADLGASLIALTTHGRSGLTRWLTGSTTDRVLQGTTHPLLVVRGQATDSKA